MREGDQTFQASAEEVDCLRRLASHDESIASLLRRQHVSSGSITTIRLDRGEAEQLRAYLTEQLARVGFEEDYSLNEQGRMLEELIDKFYLP